MLCVIYLRHVSNCTCYIKTNSLVASSVSLYSPKPNIPGQMWLWCTSGSGSGSGRMKTHANTNICIDLCCTSIRPCFLVVYSESPCSLLLLLSFRNTNSGPYSNYSSYSFVIVIVSAVYWALTLQFVCMLVYSTYVDADADNDDLTCPDPLLFSPLLSSPLISSQ